MDVFLSTGKADIQVEVWEGSMGPQYQSLLDKGAYRGRRNSQSKNKEKNGGTPIM